MDYCRTGPSVSLYACRPRTFTAAIGADAMYVVRVRLEPEEGAVLMRA
ncbi:MAG: hypothetical protein OXL34_03485 [Gemmatimonadota bacterium]|nr:hypothetical protein [Gemmatimonadota bacterium]